MKTYKVKKWPWYRFGSIHGIPKHWWIEEVGGDIVKSERYKDNCILVHGWAVPIKYCTEIKK